MRYRRVAAGDRLRVRGFAAPLAWLRLEPNAEHYVPAELRLTVWNGETSAPEERLLATTGFHGGPITWLADS